MYRKLFVSMASILFSSAVFANSEPFTGFYGSVTAGYLQSENTQKFSSDISIDDITDSFSVFINENASAKSIAKGFTGGVGLGFSGVLNHVFFWGLEGRANFENITADMNWMNTAVVSELAMGVANSITLNDDFEFLIKLGIVAMPKALIYGIVGPSWGHFKTSSSMSLSYNPLLPIIYTGFTEANDSGYQVGWLAGLGMEYSLTDHFSLALEYTHADYGDIDFPRSPTTFIDANGVALPASSFADMNSVNVVTNNIMLRLTYYLG